MTASSARPVRSARSARSGAASAARRPEGKPAARPAAEPSRPQLNVIAGARAQGRGLAEGIGRVISWTRRRNTPLLHIVVAVAFLVATLLGALALRTQMVSNSFEASQIEQRIARLTQDVEDDQAKLDALEAKLPDKAQKMGMVPQSGSLTIDLNGYQPSEGAR